VHQRKGLVKPTTEFYTLPTNWTQVNHQTHEDDWWAFLEAKAVDTFTGLSIFLAIYFIFD
jgi:hypothetical protein